MEAPCRRHGRVSGAGGFRRGSGRPGGLVTFGLAPPGRPFQPYEYDVTDLFGNTRAIKAISLWQPWASLMVAGVKLHETRHWPTAYRGPIAIHAAKTLDLAGAPDALCAAVFGQDWRDSLPRGAVLGVGNLSQCRKAETVADRLTRADLASGNFAHGRFAWRVDDLRRLTQPIPLLGRQGLFNWNDPPADLGAYLGPALDHGAACRLFGWA